MYKPEGYYVIRGRFTWVQLDEILGRPEYGLVRDEHGVDDSAQPCGLSGSKDGLTYKIYSSWVEGVGSRYAHVVLHPDGACFSGSLRVEEDWAFAKELWVKVVNRFEKYQKVLAEVHNG